MILKRADIKAYKKKENRLSCPITYEKLTEKTAVLDHSHSSGLIRKTLDRNANQFVGKVESAYKRFLGYKEDIDNLPVILRRLAMYLEEEYSENPFHPGFIDLMIRKFSRENKKCQEIELNSRGIKPGKTSKERTKQFRQFMLRKENLWKPS